MRPGDTAGLSLVAEVPADENFCYAAGGWLAEKGLAGQRLEFTLFHLATTDDPTPLCNLEGMAGESSSGSSPACVGRRGTRRL